MKRTATLALILLAALTGTARAQGGVNLYWDGCTLDGAVTEKSFACNTNSGSSFDLFASVVVPHDMPQFAAASAFIVIAFDGGSIPPWWQAGPGQCRANAIDVSFNPAVLATSCPDLWHGASNLSVFALQPGLHLPNRLRIGSGAAIPAGGEVEVLADGTELNVCRVSISRVNTVGGTGSCSGCAIGACFVLTECWLQQPAGVGDYVVNTPASNQFVYWNGSFPGCEQLVPAQNRTWGAVKGLYR